MFYFVTRVRNKTGTVQLAMDEKGRMSFDTMQPALSMRDRLRAHKIAASIHTFETRQECEAWIEQENAKRG